MGGRKVFEKSCNISLNAVVMLFALARASIGWDAGLPIRPVLISCYKLTMLQALINRHVITRAVLTNLNVSGQNRANNQCL